jgi:hypothetical protein
MPECRYCDSSFEDDDAYAAHLESEHEDELGPIDRRRLGVGTESTDDESDGNAGVIVLGALLLFAVGLVGLIVAMSPGSGSPTTVPAGQQPTALGSVHYHGAMEMVVRGERVDFSRSQYQLQLNAFHFEGGGATRWHGHARDVTLTYAMRSLGMNITDSTVTYQGTTYRDSDSNTSVSITVNGEPVTPSRYALQEGDEVRIAVS